MKTRLIKYAAVADYTELGRVGLKADGKLSIQFNSIFQKLDHKERIAMIETWVEILSGHKENIRYELAMKE